MYKEIKRVETASASRAKAPQINFHAALIQFVARHFIASQTHDNVLHIGATSSIALQCSCNFKSFPGLYYNMPLFDSSTPIGHNVVIGSTDFGHVGIQTLVSLLIEEKENGQDLQTQLQPIDLSSFVKLTSVAQRPRNDSDVLVAFSQASDDEQSLLEDSPIVVKNWLNQKQEIVVRFGKTLLHT
jgi:hypothetical protein